MAFCIGCGEFNKKYFFILFAVLSKLISQLALGLNYSIYEGIKIFDIDLSPITYFTSSFLFSLIIGIIGMVTIHQIMKKSENSITKKRNGKLKYNYIYNNKNSCFSCKNIRIQILLGIIFFFTELYDQLFYSNNYEGLDYWMFEIIFLNIFMSKYLNFNILLHQKVSLYLCVISSLILKLISNFLDSHSFEDSGKIVNVYNYIYIKYNKYWISIPIIMISFIIMLIIRAYGNTKLKYSMDILFLSPYRILMTYGLIGLIFCIIYIILSILIDFKYLGYINECVKKNNCVLTFTSSIIYGIFNSLKILFDILIIMNLSPFHMLVKYKTYYLLIQLILFCYNQTIKYKTFYFVELSSDIICFFGFLIFLELIEIRFKGLNHDLRINIIERGESEFLETSNSERACKL